MQIKFLTLYHNFDNEEYSRIQAQDSLLYMWQRSLQLRNMKFISAAKVEFKEYPFFDYPDQERVKKEIANAYGHKDKRTGVIEYWWGGKQYPDFDTLFKALAEQKRLMELIIEVKE